jgi:transcriptional regulator with XRE-family HTH domain
MSEDRGVFNMSNSQAYKLEIGTKLNKLRKQRLLTQTQLAEIVGVSQKQISLIERNEIEPRISTVRKIADALNVSREDLIS